MKAMSSCASTTARARTGALSWLSPIVTAGVRPGEAGEQGREVDHAEGLDGPDVQRAAQRAAHAGHGISARVRCVEGATGGRQQRSTRRSEPYVPTVANEQPDSDLAFERVDRGAQAGLDHVHPGCGTGEMQFLRDRDEIG